MNAWLPKDRASMDGTTGAPISILGEMPLVCQRGAMTTPGLDLSRNSGVEVGTKLLTFESEAEYLELLLSLASSGSHLVVQYVHTPEDIDPAHYWVDPKVLSYVNNKANLAALVPPGHHAERKVLDSEEAAAFLEAPPAWPFVLKAATDESSGGGVDVCICRDPEDLIKAADTFRSTPTLLWEEFLDIQRNFCLAFVAWPDGAVEHIGDTEQVSDAEGKYKGNWMGSGAEAPQDAVAAGQEAASRASALGYRGMIGIDVAETKDGRVLVFDLNFRMNGSSASALLQESVTAVTGHRVSRFRAFKFNDSYRNLLEVAQSAADRRVFLPLSTFDPEAGGYPGSPAKITGLILGDSREEVEEIMVELEAEGLA